MFRPKLGPEIWAENECRWYGSVVFSLGTYDEIDLSGEEVVQGDVGARGGCLAKGKSFAQVFLVSGTYRL